MFKEEEGKERGERGLINCGEASIILRRSILVQI
jgi:hypothetical protein